MSGRVVKVLNPKVKNFPDIMLRHEAEALLEERGGNHIGVLPDSITGFVETEGRRYLIEPERAIAKPILEVNSRAHFGIDSPNTLAEDLVYVRMTMRNFTAKQFPGQDIMVLPYLMPEEAGRQVMGGHIQLFDPKWMTEGGMDLDAVKEQIDRIRNHAIPFIATGTEMQRIVGGGQCEVRNDYRYREVEQSSFSSIQKLEMEEAGFNPGKKSDVVLSNENIPQADRDIVPHLEVRLVPAGPWVPKDTFDLLSAVNIEYGPGMQMNPNTAFDAAEDGYLAKVMIQRKMTLLRDAYKLHVKKNMWLYERANPYVRELVDAASENGLSFNSYRAALYGLFDNPDWCNPIIDAVNKRLGEMGERGPRKLSDSLQLVADELDTADGDKLRSLAVFLTHKPSRPDEAKGVIYRVEDDVRSVKSEKGTITARRDDEESFNLRFGCEDSEIPPLMRKLQDNMRSDVYEEDASLTAFVGHRRKGRIRALLDSGFIMRKAVPGLRDESSYLMEYPIHYPRRDHG